MPDTGRAPVCVRLRPAVELADEQFHAIAQLNRDLRLERNARGDLIIIPPTGGDTGERNAEITMQLRQWAKRDGAGTTFDSSTGFRLPNGAVRSPDAAWIRHSRLATVSSEERRKFIPLCPDFVVELRSPGDDLGRLQDKMQEYIDNGAQLGWLIDPDARRVYVYRVQAPVEELADPRTLDGGPLLPGFVLDLLDVWPHPT